MSDKLQLKVGHPGNKKPIQCYRAETRHAQKLYLTAGSQFVDRHRIKQT